MTELAESLLKCKVEGNIVYLPPISDGLLPNYPEVRKALLNAGAKYKKNTFIFNSPAQPFIDRLVSGESVNIKKEFQFFETPARLADMLVEFADLRHRKTFLEPSAGQGAIIDAIKRVKGNDWVIYCYEIMPENAKVLLNKYGNEIRLLGDDFLKDDNLIEYDAIIANPPFTKNQDIDHIYKMYSKLAIGGRIVSIASKHWEFSNNQKEKYFRDWLEVKQAKIEPVPEGSFKESGTNIAANILIIDK